MAGGAILAFAFLHATNSGRDELTALDLVAGVYVYEPESLLAFGGGPKVIRAVRDACGFTEPGFFSRNFRRCLRDVQRWDSSLRSE